jgi:Na+/H+ antiporter NhaB
MNLVYGIALTAHLAMSGEYNDIHPYVKLENDNYFVGAYYNSESRTSFFMGYEIGLEKETALELGIATGYNYPVVPMARFFYNDFFIMPAAEGKNLGLVVGYQFEF